MTNEEFDTLTAGSVVMCNTEGHYNKTIPGVRCSVVFARKGCRNDLFVEIMDGFFAGERYYVSSKYFDIISPLKQAEEGEILSLMV